MAAASPGSRALIQAVGSGGHIVQSGGTGLLPVVAAIVAVNGRYWGAALGQRGGGVGQIGVGAHQNAGAGIVGAPGGELL